MAYAEEQEPTRVAVAVRHLVAAPDQRHKAIVVHIPLYLPALFVSQLKKPEEVILSRRHQFRLKAEQSAKIGKGLLDCELHCQAEQARNRREANPKA